VGGPDADAFDGGEGGDDLVVGEAGEAGVGDGVLGEVEEIVGFLVGESEGAEACRAKGGKTVGGEAAIGPGGGGEESAEDGLGGLAAELLGDDGAGQGGEIGLVVGYAVGTDVLDDGVEGRVGGLEMEEGFFDGNGLAAGRINERSDS
jgi:hypothetical protein